MLALTEPVQLSLERIEPWQRSRRIASTGFSMLSEMDMRVENGKVTAFRTRVALSFKYET
jgi:uncharacterized protein YjaG (DUF416 family)